MEAIMLVLPRAFPEAQWQPPHRMSDKINGLGRLVKLLQAIENYSWANLPSKNGTKNTFFKKLTG
jgi:hypothetical protein